MLIYTHRALVFPNPESPTDPTIAGKEWFKIAPKRGPQEVPPWVRETEMYAMALAAKYIEELPDISQDKADEIIRLTKELRPVTVSPLAAETPRLRHATGIERMV